MAFEAIKIVSIISFWIIMIVFDIIPLFLKKFKNFTMILSLINCFTAGLFLATGLVHILPEANEMFSASEDEHGDEHGDEHEDKNGDEHEDEHGEEHAHGVSYAHLTLLIAFSFILFIEKVLLNKEKNTKKKHEKKQKDLNSVNILLTEISEKEMVYQNTEIPTNNISLRKDDEIELEQIKNEYNHEQDHKNNHEQDHKNNHEQDHKNNHKHDHKDTHDHSHLEIDEDSSILSVIVTLFALGIHGFMANLAIGIEDNKDTLVTLIIAVATHKWSEGLALGIILAKKNFTNLKRILIILFLSIFTPLGGLTGYFLEESNNTVKGVFLAISAGAFIYIAIMEIINEEFKSPKMKFLKFLLYVIGVALVMVLFAV